MIHFFALQSTYTHVEIGLFDAHAAKEVISLDKTVASKELIPTLHALLQRNNLSLSDSACIAVNHGPGPFTTIRTVIATVNGIGYAANIPLISVDGFTAFIQEHALPTMPTVALLNAFGKDVYFAVQANNAMRIGSAKVSTFLRTLAQEFPHQSINFIGNGALLYRDPIIDTFGAYAVFKTPTPEMPSLAQIAALGFEQWQKTPHGVRQIKPIYLKKAL